MAQKKLGLSLSGGGVRAVMYWGYIQELEDNGIEVHALTAHSGGALVLCLMAADEPREEVLQKFSKFKFWHHAAFNPLGNRGMLSNEKLVRYFAQYTKGKQIQDLPWQTFIPIADLTDFDHPKELVITEGDLARYSVISSIIPPIMPLYVDEEGRKLADGGITSLYSADSLRGMGAEIIVGLYPDGLKVMQVPGIVDDILRTLKSLMSMHEKFERVAEPIDYEVRNFKTPGGFADSSKVFELYESGRRKAQETMDDIKALIEFEE